MAGLERIYAGFDGYVMDEAGGRVFTLTAVFGDRRREVSLRTGDSPAAVAPHFDLGMERFGGDPDITALDHAVLQRVWKAMPASLERDLNNVPQPRISILRSFKNWCEFWITRFGLLDWGFRFKAIPQEEEPDYRACVRGDWNNRHAEVSIVTPYEHGVFDLIHSAFHEIVHVVLWEFRHVIESRWIDEDRLHSARMGCVYRFRRFLLGE